MIARFALGMLILIVIAIVAVIRCTPVKADEEHMRLYHADTAMDEFLGGLKVPTGEWPTGVVIPGGQGCCNQKDCHRVDAEWTKAGWVILLPNGQRLPVPPDRVVRGAYAPDGEAYACFRSAFPGWPACFTEPTPGT